MGNKNIRAILFDFGGVLAEEGFRNGLIKLATEQGLDAGTMPKQAMQAVYDSGFVLGQGTATDFWELLRKRTGVTGEDDTLTQTILSGFIIRPWMIELVKHLRGAGYITGILSDQTHWLDRLNEKYQFYVLFDKVYNSYYLGKGKQDPSLFNDVAVDLKMSAFQILFVDDDAGNVARARDAGWQTIYYTDQKSFIKELQKYGIMLY